MSSARTVKCYTPEEDELILNNWWDPARRKEIARKLGRPEEGIGFGTIASCAS